MDKTLYLINLFDYYGELLTETQRTYFKDYYFKNLSLSEISENRNVSRNGIYKVIKECEKKLCYYEEKLKLYSKFIQIKKILDDKTFEKIEELI